MPVSALFRDGIASDQRSPRLPYVAATVLLGCTIPALAIGLAYDRRIAAIFVLAAVGVFVLLWLVAALITLTARHLPRPRSPVVRLAIANICRPGALTPNVAGTARRAPPSPKSGSASMGAKCSPTSRART